MSGEGIIFGPIHFQNTQEGLRYHPGFRADLEARGPPAALVDLDRGHRETAILPASIRRQLTFVGNVWIFRGLYYTESSKVLLCIKLLQCLKLSCKVLIKKKKSVNSIWLPGVPQPGPEYPLSPSPEKEKRDLDLYTEIPSLCHHPDIIAFSTADKAWSFLHSMGHVCFPTLQHLQMFSGNLLQAGEERSKFLVFLYINISSLVPTSMCDSFSIQDVHLNRHEVRILF